MKCFIGDSFSFLGADFANIPLTFLISSAVHTRYSKALKYSEQYFRDHLSDFLLSKSLNSPNLCIKLATMCYPDYQNKKKQIAHAK